MVMTISLSNARNTIAIFDDDMADFVFSKRWELGDTGYVEYRTPGRKGKHIKMHHAIFGKPLNGFVTDHINGNKLDNRRVNLRFVRQSFNMASAHKNSKGYYWCKQRRLWCVSLTIEMRRVNGGRFAMEEDAKRRVAEIRSLRDAEQR